MSRNGFRRGVVIGGSAGGFQVLVSILSALPDEFPLPFLIVQHLHVSDDGSFSQHLARASKRRVVEPCDKEPIEPGCVYVAPADYHMLLERKETIALSIDERVTWSRPSIDVLFESAAGPWGPDAIAILLTGANADGTRGMRAIRQAGGLTIAQDPACAETPFMPQSAINAGVVNEVLGVEQIAERLISESKP